MFQIQSVFAARLKEHCGRSNGSLLADMSTALDCKAKAEGPGLEPKFHAKESFTLPRQFQRQSHFQGCENLWLAALMLSARASSKTKASRYSNMKWKCHGI
jgi:hypothetical protein